MNTRQLSVLCSILLLTFSGCIFSPKKKDGDPPKPKPIYRVPASPEIALANYVSAYESRDSTQMELIYADDYLGTSIDQTQPVELQTTHFTKADEVNHVGRLYSEPTISGVSLVLGGGLIRFTDLNDPAGWATIQTPSMILNIYDGQVTRMFQATGETFEFRFSPKTPDSASPTDTTWRIVRWNEFYNP